MLEAGQGGLMTPAVLAIPASVARQLGAIGAPNACLHWDSSVPFSDGSLDLRWNQSGSWPRN